MQKILSVKDVASSAVQVMPQAALAWTGVCFALQVSLRFLNVLNSTITSEDFYQLYNREQDESRRTRSSHR